LTASARRSQDAIGRTYIPDNPGWGEMMENLAQVPVVSLGLGAVAGLHAARLVCSHYSVMVAETSHMFMAGPPVMARLGQTFTKEELGGAELQARAGSADDVAARQRCVLVLRPRSAGLLRTLPGLGVADSLWSLRLELSR